MLGGGLGVVFLGGGGGGVLVDLLHNTLSFFQKVTNCYKGGRKGEEERGEGG